MKRISKLICRIRNSLHIRIQRSRILPYLKLFTAKLFYNKNKVLFLSSASHTNMGDQAQSVCIREWLKKNYPSLFVLELNTTELLKQEKWIYDYLRKITKENELIFIQSGYNITDIYSEQEHVHRKIIETFPNNKIVFFPQTIFFSDTEKGHKEEAKSRTVYNNHKNIVLLCRDKISYEFGKTLFLNCKTFLFPDIVTTKIGTAEYDHNNREGVLLCVRHDAEKLYSDNEINFLYERLKKNEPVTMFDTTITDKTGYQVTANRKKYLNRMLDTFAKHRIVITDRYHGIIFSLIANTPVIVLRTNDHKVSAGLEWYQGLMSENLYSADSLDDALKIAQNVKPKDTTNNTNPFCLEFYDKLKAMLEE